MTFFISLFIFFAGLIFGSFFAAYSYRLPKNISIAKGRSFCPKCKKNIHWFDNIPLFSYFMLGGKCRNCGKKISIRYPLIELATGLGFLFVFNFRGESLQGVYSIIIFSILLLIFIVDFEHQIIPDKLIFLGIFFVFLISLLFGGSSLFSDLFAGFLAALFLMLIHLATRGRGMGLGDVKFAIFGGMIVGLNLFLVWLFASFLTGGISGIILILGRFAKLKDKIAFGPFLVIGIILTIFFGKYFLSFLGF